MNLTIFTLSDKDYGIDIEQVLQVIRMRPVVPIPNTKPYVEGVISLRGKVMPIVNLRKKLGLKDTGLKKYDRIIITRSGDHVLGVVVDKVVGVIKVDPGAISSPDEILRGADYLMGVTKMDKKLVLVADVEKMFSAEDKNDLKKVRNNVQIRKRD